MLEGLPLVEVPLPNSFSDLQNDLEGGGDEEVVREEEFEPHDDEDFMEDDEGLLLDQLREER